MALEYNRRTFIKGVSAASVIGASGLAGCLGDDEPIPIGSILPMTGALEDFGPGMEDAMEVAVEEINDAGGINGREVDWIARDSETNPVQGEERYEELVAEEDAEAIIGAASSGVSVPIAENTADDQVMQVSPASTTPVLVDIGWDGDLKYFGRTAPNDGQQGLVMAWVMNEQLDVDTAGFLHIDNPYGEGLAEVAEEHFEGESVGLTGYDEEDPDFSATLDSLFDDDPEAIGFVGYTGEGESIMQLWDEGGYGGEWVLSEGLHASEFLEGQSDILEGFHITTPDPEATPGRENFEEMFPGELAGVFEPHTYDAMILTALAMEYSEEATGTGAAEGFMEVAVGPGEEVTAGEYEEAIDLINDGEDIQYLGASSPLDMNDNREALNPFAAQEILGDGSTEAIETFDIDWFIDQGL